MNDPFNNYRLMRQPAREFRREELDSLIEELRSVVREQYERAERLSGLLRKKAASDGRL